MELIFVRHGQGEHNTNIPNRLQIKHPHLTEKGIRQVAELQSTLKIKADDILVVSPTVRTIETARFLVEGLNRLPAMYISPLAGPRAFPISDYSTTVPCDIPLTVDELTEYEREFTILHPEDQEIWPEGINLIRDDIFFKLGEGLINWLKRTGKDRVLMITHDGTITNYRKLLGEQGLTRSDFLGEAGVFKMMIKECKH